VQAVKPDAKTEDLMRDAARALAAGDAASARASLRAVVGREPRNVGAWLNLAAAARAQGDLVAALAAIDSALCVEPRNFFALLGRASVLERQGEAKAAAEAYGVASGIAPPEERLDAASRKMLRHGRELHARHVADLEAYLKESLEGVFAGHGKLAARKAEAFIGTALHKRRIYRQEPVEFFWPGLPAIEFYERELFPWLAEFEAATSDIRNELIALIREDAGELVPYVDYPDSQPLDQWRELNHSLRWGAYHLMLYGEPVAENVARVPKTMAAIAGLPQPRVPRRSPAAMFSVLQPKTRIPPHTGVSNTRLVVHLPLIVPEGCAFRVGGETRPWREGEAWVFDDTIEHEAWNESDERRVILICDVWSPFLSETDRDVVTRVMTAMDEFKGGAPEAGL
jgi:aspartyl/asparaginyl beta-hydroxylase (cupin superfamily)